MKTLQDGVKELAKKSVKIEDSAVSEYIRQQAENIRAKGKNLEDYYLVRESGQLSYDGGTNIKAGVLYGLKHKDSVKIVEVSS